MIELGVFITGLTQAIRMAGVPGKYLPVVAVLLGIAMNAMPYLSAGYVPLLAAISQGAMVGLITTGLVNFAGKRVFKMPVTPDNSGPANS